MPRNAKSSIFCIALFIAATASAEVVDSPRYKSWAKHKPGTSVSQTIETKAGTESNTTDVKQTLVEVLPDKVIIDVDIRFSRLGNSRSVPTQRVEFPSKAEKNSDLLPPDVQASFKEARTETVEIVGRTVTCRIVDFEGEQKTRAGQPIKTTGSVWISEDMPGAIVQILRSVEISGPDGVKLEGTTNTAVAAIDIKQ